MPRKNHFRNYAGYRASGRTEAGATRVVYLAEEQGIDTGSHKWACVCEAHGQILAVPTLAHAKASITDTEWCSGCSPEEDFRK
jgi:hypothetical protein